MTMVHATLTAQIDVRYTRTRATPPPRSVEEVSNDIAVALVDLARRATDAGLVLDLSTLRTGYDKEIWDHYLQRDTLHLECDAYPPD